MIDYENVGRKGLDGYKELQESDHVYIFYTKDASNVSLDIVKDIINNSGKAAVKIQEVEKKRKGDQSLDFCLASYLGYLIAVNKGKDCSYIIVSKDDGYEAVKKFWEDNDFWNISDLKNVNISKREMIKLPLKEESAKEKASAKKENQAKKESAGEKDESTRKADTTKQPASLAKQTSKGKGGVKTELNKKVQQVLSQAKYSNEVINGVAKLVTSCYDEDHPEQFKNNVHNGLREKYPEDYLEIYGSLKSLLGEYSSVSTPASTNGSGTDKNVINNRVQQILSKAKVSADVIGYVASVVVKNFGVKNSKQQIYRMIISEYGQQKGLDIYNKIKKYIP